MEYLELLEDGKFQAIKLSNTSCSDASGKGKIKALRMMTHKTAAALAAAAARAAAAVAAAAALAVPSA